MFEEKTQYFSLHNYPFTVQHREHPSQSQNNLQIIATEPLPLMHPGKSQN